MSTCWIRHKSPSAYIGSSFSETNFVVSNVQNNVIKCQCAALYQTDLTLVVSSSSAGASMVFVSFLCMHGHCF